MAKQATFQPITPAYPRALSPINRQRIEDRIEELIAVLDTHDAPSEYLEPVGDNEPDNDGEGSLGWPEDINQDLAIKACTNDDAGVLFGPDRERDDADSEPSLGWTEAARAEGMHRFHPPQFGGTDDREFEDEREPEDYI